MIMCFCLCLIENKEICARQISYDNTGIIWQGVLFYVADYRKEMVFTR